jgi:hypothetical protein
VEKREILFPPCGTRMTRINEFAKVLLKYRIKNGKVKADRKNTPSFPFSEK